MKMNWLSKLRTYSLVLLASGFLISASLTSCGGKKGSDGEKAQKESQEGSGDHEHPEDDKQEHPEGDKKQDSAKQKEEHPEGEKEEHPNE